MYTKYQQHLPLIPISMICILLASALSAQQIISGNATLGWDDNSNNETGFCIEYRVNGGTWTEFVSVGPDVTTYGPFSLAPSNTYSFRVHACNLYGESEPTNTVDIIFSDPTPDAPQITGIVNYGASSAQLTWNSVASADNYNVYRGTSPNFVPDKSGGSNRIASAVNDTDPGTPDVQWTDTNAGVGNATVNYFYIVTAVNASAESDNSNVVGDFDFQLITTPTTDFNEITLALEIPGISTAADLMNIIPGCNSVAKWNAETQSYKQYISIVPRTNFDVELGEPYYVNVTSNTVFSMVGAEVSKTYSLITTPSTDFNEIMLPLNKTNLTKASELMVDIPNCNSVAYWNASTQSYKQYISIVPRTDFDIMPGNPYYVNVTANTTWPSGGLSKRAMSQNTQSLSDMDIVTNAPHSVWGELDETIPETNNLNLTAYITARPDEILTQESPECEVGEGYWLIQCSSFASQWNAGDILKVIIQSNDGSIYLESEIELTYEPADQGYLIANTTSTDNPLSAIPGTFELNQNYPNPFNPQTTIPYQLAQASQVRLSIFNSRGQKISDLVDDYQSPGNYKVVWNGMDANGYKVGSGVYVIQMDTAQFRKTRKITLLQ